LKISKCNLSSVIGLRASSRPGLGMGKVVHIANGEARAVPGSLLVVCVPGSEPPNLAVVGGPWEFIYGVGTDNWLRLRAQLETTHPDKDIYVVGAPDAPKV